MCVVVISACYTIQNYINFRFLEGFTKELSVYVCVYVTVCVCVSVAQLLLKASEPMVRTASVALMRDYIAITLLLYTNASPVHLCVVYGHMKTRKCLCRVQN